MTVFISHSSKDKPFVARVVDELGPLNVEYDEQTFEHTFNVQAIRQALRRSTLVVLFLSKFSVSSTFVAEEQRQMLEALGRGDLERILIIAIDDTSFRSLPEWMQEINVTRIITNPKVAARKIESVLIEVRAEEAGDELYLGRDDEESALRRALAVPKDRSPVYLHISGFQGVGRRTFLRHSLQRLFPRYYEAFLEILMSRHQGLDDLYRDLYGLQRISSLADAIKDFTQFQEFSYDQQIKIVSDLVSEMIDDGSILVVNDDFNVLDDRGEYQDYWSDIYERLKKIYRPAVAFIQSRMQPPSIRSAYDRAYHVRLHELSDTSSEQLVALSLRSQDIDFTHEQLKQLKDLVDGHPYNLRFAVEFARQYGLEDFLSNPRDFIEWKHRRGEDFLAQLDFTDIQVKIVSALADYRHLSSELMLSIISIGSEELSDELRSLQDFCCVEYRNGFFQLSSPIREAVRRDTRFQLDAEWYQEVAQKICDVLGGYKEEETVEVQLIEAATLASIKGGAAPAYLRNVVLPSHYLFIARDHYDRGLRRECIDFCKKALEGGPRMTADAKVEAVRLWGLSAARMNDDAEFNAALSHLKEIHTSHSGRIRLFLEGFFARLKGNLSTAERKFLEAHRLSERNPHINRELASLYCRQKRYDEAEAFARSTYEIQRTNPFIIDILLEILIGKRANGERVDEREIARLRDELEQYSHESETIFFELRGAQERISERDYAGAMTLLEEALKINSSLSTPYFLAIEAELGRGNVPGAEKYLSRVEAMLNKQGQSEGDECKLLECQIMILAEKQHFSAAISELERERNLPDTFIQRIKQQLARSIAFSSDGLPAAVRTWAHDNA